MPTRGPGYAGKPQSPSPPRFRNGSLQAAYLIMAARALGLDAGPMSGFDNEKMDEVFLSGTGWRRNMLINLGYGDHPGLRPPAPPRLRRGRRLA